MSTTTREKARSKGLRLLFHVTTSRRYRDWYQQRSILPIPCCDIAWGQYWYGKEYRISIGWLIFQVDLYAVL